MNSPFDKLTGSDKINSFRTLLFILTGLVFAGIIIGVQGIPGSIGLLAMPFAVLFMFILFRKPLLGLYTIIVLGFLLLGIGRYIKGFQFGTLMDAMLVLTYIALFFNRFREKINWTPARKDITLLAGIWFLFTLLQFFNPESRSSEAWLTSFRGLSLYMMLLVPLVLLMIDNREKLDKILILWASMSVLASLKGIMQNTIGVDPFEKVWLESGGAITHILFGKLRMFSFMSDAGQFGANQAYAGVVFGILAGSVKSRKKQAFYLLTSVLGFYGMFLSGTRGAISVPMAGFGLYSVLRKNKFIMLAGFLSLVMVYVFFKYTYIGQDNQQIRRMRSAFDPNDPSFQVRLENQRKLSAYLATRPFGGGVGHAGIKAQRFLPNSFLAGIATDSWYVLIWAEMGIVGLALHLFILLYIIGKSSWLCMFVLKDKETIRTTSALIAGMVGVMVASYGNAVLGTMPTSVLVYISMALVLNSRYFDQQALAFPQQKGK